MSFLGLWGLEFPKVKRGFPGEVWGPGSTRVSGGGGVQSSRRTAKIDAVFIFAAKCPLQSRPTKGLGANTIPLSDSSWCACLPLFGGPLAATQPIEKFLSKPDFGAPSGLFPPGKPSVEMRGFAPHLN